MNPFVMLRLSVILYRRRKAEFQSGKSETWGPFQFTCTYIGMLWYTCSGLDTMYPQSYVLNCLSEFAITSVLQSKDQTGA